MSIVPRVRRSLLVPCLRVNPLVSLPVCPLPPTMWNLVFVLGMLSRFTI